MRKDEAVGNMKKIQVCLPKHNYKLDNNLLTVEPRAVDPHCFEAIRSRMIEGSGFGAGSDPREARKHLDPTDPDSVPDPQYWLLLTC